MDRLAREGTEYLAVEPAYPARTVVCFSSMLTGATPAEHGMRSNFAPRLGVRSESVFDVLERDGRRGRLVGIAHLLDPFGEDVVRSVTSVQPTVEIDRSLAAEARRVVDEEDPDLLVLQLLAADQLGHVRGVRSPEYLDQLAETDRRVGEFLAFLERARQARRRHRDPHGRPRPGPRDRRPWPPRLGRAAGAVRGLGRGRACRGAVSHEPRSVLELAATISRLLGLPAPEAARGRPLVPAGGPAPVEPRRRRRGAASRSSWRATRRPPSAACSPGIPSEACGMPVDVLARRRRLARRHRRHRAASTARAWSRIRSRAGSAPRFAPASRSRATRATPPPSTSTATASTTRPTSRASSSRSRAAAPTTCSARASSASRDGMSWHRTLANRTSSALLGLLMQTVTSDGQTGYRAFSARALAGGPHRARLQLRAGAHRCRSGAQGIEPVEVPIRYRAPHERPLVRPLPGVPRAGRPGGLARVARRARLAQDEGQPPRPPARPRASTPSRRPARTAAGQSVSGPNGASGRSAARASRRPSARRRRATPTPRP